MVAPPPQDPAPPAADGRERWRFGLYAAHLLTLFGLAISNVALGLGLLAAPWLRDRELAVWRRARPLLLALAAYVAWLLVAVVFSQEPRASVRELAEIFALAALPLALLSVAGERRVRFMVDALIVVVAALALAGLGQLLVGYGAIDRRIRGPFSHYMTFSGVLLLVDLLLIARMIAGRPAARVASRRPLDRRWVEWLCLGLITWALIGTLTRNAWLGLLAGLVWLLWVRRRRWLWAAPAAAACFLLLAPVPVVARALSTVSLSDDSNYDRLCMLDAGARMTAQHPLFGIGPQLVERLYPIYRHPTAPRFNVPHLHNSYVQLAAERGLPGLAAYLALLGVALAAAWRGYRREGPAGGRADLWLGAAAALIAFALSGLFEHNWGDTEVQRTVLFLMALPFCLEPRGEARAVERQP